MKRKTLFRALAASLFLCCLSGLAQEMGYWRASSTSAKQITGDVSLAEEKLFINFYTTPMSRIRALNAAEVSSVFDVDTNAGGTGSLYRLNIPAEKKFLHKNSLCGSESAQWMAAYASGNTLQLAFFSGVKPPQFTFDAMSNSTDRCGTFVYVR